MYLQVQIIRVKNTKQIIDLILDLGYKAFISTKYHNNWAEYTNY